MAADRLALTEALARLSVLTGETEQGWTAGEHARQQTERCRVAPGVRQRGTAVPAESSASPAVSVVPGRADREGAK